MRRNRPRPIASVFRSLVVLVVLMAGTLLVVQAPAEAGARTVLKVKVTGLPAGVAASISVKGPKRLRAKLTQGKTFRGPGRYRLSAKPVQTATGVATPSWTKRSVKVKAGKSVTVTVAYATSAPPVSPAGPPTPGPASVQAGVSGFAASDVYSSGAHLTWSNPDLLPGAVVVVRRDDEPVRSPGQGVEVPLDPSGTGATDSGLASETTYFYGAFVRGASGPVPAPATTSATTPEGGTTLGDVPATTEMLSVGDITDAEATSGGVRITVPQGVAVPPNGGSMLIPPSDDFPDGMVAQVISSRTNLDRSTSVVLDRGALASALPGLVIDQSASFEMEPVESNADDGTMELRRGAGGRTSVRLAASAFECSADGVAMSPADLFDSANPLPFSLEFSNWDWNQYFNAGNPWPFYVAPALSLQLSGEADLIARFRPLYGEFSCELSPTWRRHHRLFQVRIPVPGVPVPITLKVELGLKFSVKGDGGIEFKQHRYWGIHVHKWADEALGVTMSGSEDPTEFEVSGSVSASAELFADLSVMAGGGYGSANAQAGLYGTFGPYASLDAKVTSADPDRACLTAEVGFKSEIGVRLELWVNRWNVELGSINWAKKKLYDSCDDIDPAAGTDGLSLGSGDVQATLRWDNNDDMDLHVIDPAGDEIYYRNTSVDSGGQLDHDNIPGCDAPEVGNGNAENIFWPSGDAPAGSYTVFVHEYNNCSQVNALWTLTVRVDGRTVLSQSGYGSSSSYTFTVPSSRSSARSRVSATPGAAPSGGWPSKDSSPG
jgi:hypothetical protein